MNDRGLDNGDEDITTRCMEWNGRKCGVSKHAARSLDLAPNAKAGDLSISIRALLRFPLGPRALAFGVCSGRATVSSSVPSCFYVFGFGFVTMRHHTIDFRHPSMIKNEPTQTLEGPLGASRRGGCRARWCRLRRPRGCIELAAATEHCSKQKAGAMSGSPAFWPRGPIALGTWAFGQPSGVWRVEEWWLEGSILDVTAAP